MITDSTSSLPHGLAEELDVGVVPLQIELPGRVGREGDDIGPAQVTAALKAHARVTTSRPSPAEFVAAYQARLATGADSVVSIHLSAQLSGTCDSARLAASEFAPGVVTVVDSRATAMALGFAVIAAAQARDDGASPAQVASAAVTCIDRSTALFYVDSLDWLHRGGRIGAAATLVGTALSVKPILHVVQGRIVPLEKVRTSAKAVARLIELAVEAAGASEVDIAVQHLDAEARAVDVATQLQDRVPSLVRCYRSEVGAVVGAHVGPGLIGVVIRRR